jgi:TetR/AcrR family transcriptional regulator, multidrug resistance operon repressor
MRVKDIAKEKTILETALSMIEKEGLAGLKMGALAKRAGVATGTLYIYYESKEAIVQALYDYVFGQISLDMVRDIDPNADTKTKLRQVAANYVNELLTYPRHHIFVEQYLRSPFVREGEQKRSAISAYIEPIAQIFETGMEQGQLKSTDPWLMLTVSRGALDTFGWRLVTNNDSKFDQASFETVFSVLWDGMSRR